MSREIVTQNDFGRVVRLWCRRDISSYTTFEMVFTSPSNTSIVKTASLGTTAVTTDLGTFPANEYIEYTVEEKLLSEPGLWEVRARVKKSGIQITGEPHQFMVGPEDGVETISVSRAI